MAGPPRLYLDAERVAQLRAAIQTTHTEIWAGVKRQADSVAGRRPAAYFRSDRSEQWQMSVGASLPYLAMEYLLTGKTNYLDSAKEWSLASCGYPRWGDGADLSAGYQLFGLALTYWSLGVDAMLKFWYLAADLPHEKPSSQWWANTGYYRLYLSLPRSSWSMTNKVVDFADCTRSDWVGPDYLPHRLAALNRDGHLKWFARQPSPVTNCGLFSEGGWRRSTRDRLVMERGRNGFDGIES